MIETNAVRPSTPAQQEFLASLCRKVILNKTYVSVEDMQEKLDMFVALGRISNAHYQELTTMLSAVTE